AGEHVGESARAPGAALAVEPRLLADLDQIHCGFLGVGVVGCCGRPSAIRANATRLARGPSGIDADGDAPGCRRAIRTRRTPGRIWKFSGGSSSIASPSMPAAIG